MVGEQIGEGLTIPHCHPLRAGEVIFRNGRTSYFIMRTNEEGDCVVDSGFHPSSIPIIEKGG